ncbi:hypothetical protein D5S17_23520 [Pseudonocardiaceae bacterium YIM PH 21723]|nr:hypothetical protein D5S17_23520 [Pseudonocardiaceae bacterium YIM PH 21723]
MTLDRAARLCLLLCPAIALVAAVIALVTINYSWLAHGSTLPVGTAVVSLVLLVAIAMAGTFIRRHRRR